MNEPVVLLHGVGLDSSMWDTLVIDGALWLAGREVMALDLPGHGWQPPLRKPTSLSEMADDVARRLPPKAHLVGFSLGALVAQEIAAREPGRVLSLTCVSSVCQRTEAEAAAVARRLEAAREDFAASAEAALERWFPDAGRVPADLVENVRSVLLANDRESYLHAYEVFATGDRDASDALPLITAPTLAITGSEDPGSTPEMTLRLSRSVAGARALVVDGARHMLPLEQPEQLARLIAEFADEAERKMHHASTD
ncbi:pimeloyl-ACP methyl ester carboxylesterase [Sinomonas atrocyanea]|uniref:alpha/beta fold hydrolase n=1 Tax=Sinomonas atrocyanea TaxID=37927 RepID=UPI00278892BA|nr:alpha/beta hydrolase [Sinomonas atrocyanea]MDP9886062.1 pimeloyl-ACP methyl ester carboxylesterase [Sinomonas atrocyanea]